MKFYEDKMNNINQQKQKNYFEKALNRSTIEKNKGDLYNKNHSYRNDQKHIANLLDDQHKKEMDEDYTIKKHMKLKRLYEKNMQMNHKTISSEKYRNDLRNNYGNYLTQKHMQTEDYNDRVKKLEQFEMALIDRLRATHSK